MHGWEGGEGEREGSVLAATGKTEKTAAECLDVAL